MPLGQIWKVLGGKKEYRQPAFLGEFDGGMTVVTAASVAHGTFNDFGNAIVLSTLRGL